MKVFPSALLLIAGAGVAAADPKIFFQKGVNFTAEWPGGYGSDGARRMLKALPDYGVNAIALVPYGFTSRKSLRVSFGSRMESDEGIAKVVEFAHSLGVRVLLKPQLWLGGGQYPGDLDFDTASDRARWFAEYRLFVEHYAQLARQIQADVFCVGVEFAKLVQYEKEWRAIIARARELYSGPLVYAANCGPEFERLAFWDALDYIGLNEYCPLPDDLAMDEVVRKVEAVQQKFRRPVIFTEVGFSSYVAPHREPWAENPRNVALEDQARCYDAVFRAFYRKPWFRGMYWWKVGTNGDGGPHNGAHTPWDKPAMEVVKKWYRGPAR